MFDLQKPFSYYLLSIYSFISNDSESIDACE